MGRYIERDGFTKSFRTLRLENLPSETAYVFASDSNEERGRLGVWGELLRSRPEACVEIIEQHPTSMVCQRVGQHANISLTDSSALQALFSLPAVCIDITGLTHSVWAALLRIALNHSDAVACAYSEPTTYQEHHSPSSSSLYDLTAEFTGVAPLPGMASLSGPDSNSRTVLVPFLGFESARAKHIAYDFDPIPHIVPVVGLPGFRYHYPQITISTNSEFLEQTRAYRHVKYAKASCPFEAYSTLSEIHRDFPDAYLHIAPIGTKPHALGAVWYALEHPLDTEIVYDHPIRKARRTAGVGHTHIYYLKPYDADL